jgi:hypothetical protein
MRKVDKRTAGLVCFLLLLFRTHVPGIPECLSEEGALACFLALEWGVWMSMTATTKSPGVMAANNSIVASSSMISKNSTGT